MLKNRIPIWDNLGEYPENLKELAETLIAISDKDYQKRVWYYGIGPEVDDFTECSLGFDDDIEFLKVMIRRKEVNLSKEQIKAILRVHVMSNRFDRMSFDHFPKGHERVLSIIEHPYWRKIGEQAAYALSLLKKHQD